MSYYVVEYRLPVEIHDVGGRGEDAAKNAAEKAKNIIEGETGVRLNNWHARVFEYGDSGDDIGPVAEFFFGPSGDKARKVDKNMKEDL